MLNKTKIWEAARATSAATTFFDPITIGTETFVDGATGANNPIQELMIEAYKLWSEKLPGWKIEYNLQCVVSVGTGMPSLEPFGKKLWDVPQTLLSIATDTERTAEKWQRTHDTLFREKRAFRFNVMAGLENIGLEDSKRQGDILAATKRYIALQNVLDQMNDCAANLQTRECMSTMFL
jgi:predicted acylesterase/phospholipase RssA